MCYKYNERQRRVSLWGRETTVRAMKARFDGSKIVLPKEAKSAPPGEVIVVFPEAPIGEGDAETWLAAQQESFVKVWDNEEDSVYDAL